MGAHPTCHSLTVTVSEYHSHHGRYHVLSDAPLAGVMASITPGELANLTLALRTATARLAYLRGEARLTGEITPHMQREITKARSHRDRVRRELTARERGAESYAAARKQRRDYTSEYQRRKQREKAIREGQRKPRPPTAPELDKAFAVIRKHQVLQNMFRDRTTLSRDEVRILLKFDYTTSSIFHERRDKRRRPEILKLESEWDATMPAPFPWGYWRGQYVGEIEDDVPDEIIRMRLGLL